MLDNVTKKRIDDCRDILVGKLPDPKSQIEQITIALIYKFMDDMDKEAIELGGKAKFFSDYTIPDPNDLKKEIVVPFEKYSWDNLFDTKVSATEMLKLYSEAIEGMVKNPNIPELFSNIFKNAYLPYRDPETLKMFLKTISEFEYTHSEKLGDAFEYLLSVMGSQGDAGQFRTPRHIIDFLVAAVDPNKNDTILDPACGTAGFLISAFKHIKEQNNNKLTPDEQKRLIKNFVGYDISPDMVRLSLVNLYLHGFSDPHIHEYDSLSSEDRWNETFDVVLANPPFMSPKGGIRPHKKFTISSNRSEVLFVDYIAEHLNPKGRAGIIVPEGIIFQSGTAYKALRKMLVDKYLYAVVSLPAGVFNPYSGVKTSILLMDADLAKKTKDVLFVKIDNDGYGLGAQRNAIKGGQLEEAVQIIHDFAKSHRQTDNVETPCMASMKENKMAQIVSKTEIGKSGDYNLSGERYKKLFVTDSTFPMVELSDETIFKVISGGTPSSEIEEYWNGDINWATLADLPSSELISKLKETKRKITDKGLKNSSAKVLPVNSILVSTRATIGRIAINKEECSTNQGFKNIIINDFSKANTYYVALMMTKLVDKMNSMATGGTFKELSTTSFRTLEIPLPPLSVQEEIVAEIESYQKIIDGAKMVVDNYKPRIEIDTDWEMIELGKFVEFNQTGLVKNKQEQSIENTIPYIKMDGITYDGQLSLEKLVYVNCSKDDFDKYNLKKDDFLYNTRNTPDLVGKSAVFNFEDNKYLFNNNIMRIRFNNRLNPYFVNYILNADYYKTQIRSFVDSTTSVAALYPKNYFSIKIPVPTIETQQQIVSQIEKEQALVNANKELIAIYEQKIKDRIGRVWGEKEKTVTKKLSNDLYLAMMLKQMEKKIQLNYGEVATQKTVFHLNTFTDQKLHYPFINSNYGTYSYLLKEDLLKNPYLSKTKKGSGEVFVVTTSKENEVVEALSNPENKEFVAAINEVLKIYQTPLINKETENIELLNTVSKVILDKQSTDLEIVYAGMQEWNIEQNGFKTKADKFTKSKTKRMIDLIEKLGLVGKLIK
ncbi:N-6 DNA methylase [Flavobacterium sp.]|uniref:N-6 DNA methylase n=1 Tax=Flavobacterium sp. TaxID=239 RepID=UPI002615AC0A|nr:N-6 DNA methylase [Flavobacterium sp.]